MKLAGKLKFPKFFGLQPTLASLNSTKYTNKFFLLLFMVHKVVAVGFVCFLVFKGVQGLIGSNSSVKRKEQKILRFLLPQVEAASFLSIVLAFLWQLAFRLWPDFMIHFILWSTFLMSLSSGILLLCFQMPATDAIGVCLVAFSIGNGLYACWATRRIKFCSKILAKSLEPVSKFSDLNLPTYYMLAAGFFWMSLWIFGVIGALNFYFPPLVIIGLVLSLLWTTEVMRNVVNLTVSRVVALYYLRGMQSSTRFSFQRALSRNLGSACLGSLFVPTIEALRIVARGLNLLKGEDEFMFCCANCCLKLMDFIFEHGNGWAFVQVLAKAFEVKPCHFSFSYIGISFSFSKEQVTSDCRDLSFLNSIYLLQLFDFFILKIFLQRIIPGIVLKINLIVVGLFFFLFLSDMRILRSRGTTTCVSAFLVTILNHKKKYGVVLESIVLGHLSRAALIVNLLLQII